MKNVVKYGKIVRNLYTITSAIHSRVSHKHLKGGAGGGGGGGGRVGGHCSPLGWALGVGDGGATSGYWRSSLYQLMSTYLHLQ